MVLLRVDGGGSRHGRLCGQEGRLAQELERDLVTLGLGACFLRELCAVNCSAQGRSCVRAGDVCKSVGG